MELYDKQAIQQGSKKKIVKKPTLIDNIREHYVSKAFAILNTFDCFSLFFRYILDGYDPNCQDSVTGETFVHVLCDSARANTDARGTRVLYVVAAKADINIKDNNGQTPLHKIVLVPGAWRWIVAFIRCGACPLIKNNFGRDVEQEILFHKREGWEENLHWLRKFYPGIWAAVACENPDAKLVEKLLKFWCRTSRIVGPDVAYLKYQSCSGDVPLDISCLIDKYENTIDMALSMMTGKYAFGNFWPYGTEKRTDIDVNVRDFSYQFHFRDYPASPRPLIVAVWELDEPVLIERFLMLQPELYVKYTFESQATSPPKPLFFHVFNPKIRPKNEAVTKVIIKHVDLSLRNVYGQTALMEAVLNDERKDIIRALLNAGVDVASRDAEGRTAREHCEILKRQDYIDLIDGFVKQLVKEENFYKIQRLILHMYDESFLETAIKPICPSFLFKDYNQAKVKALFSMVTEGSKLRFMETVNDIYSMAKDKTGRSLLHFAIQGYGCSKNFSHRMETDTIRSTKSQSTLHHMSHCNGKHGEPIIRNAMANGCSNGPKALERDTFPDHLGIIQFLISKFPFLLQCTNNLGQTPLHYAYIYSVGQEVINDLERAGSLQVKDVFDFLPQDYTKEKCGSQTFLERQKPTHDLHLDIFLKESHFEDEFFKALKSGDIQKVKDLTIPLLDHHGHQRFKNILFDCLDGGHTQLVCYLIDSGFEPSVSKQYTACQPDDPMCAMMECNHHPISLRQRAIQIGASDVVSQIDNLQII